MSIAEKIYKQIVEMPIKEREKLFAAIARQGFEKETYSHEEVFGELRQRPFIISETAEYLGVSVITLRRWVKQGKIKAEKIGKNLVFEVDELKRVKRASLRREVTRLKKKFVA